MDIGGLAEGLIDGPILPVGGSLGFSLGETDDVGNILGLKDGLIDAEDAGSTEIDGFIEGALEGSTLCVGTSLGFLFGATESVSTLLGFIDGPTDTDDNSLGSVVG
eukprot:scaffold422524_cov79-Attheya_sp.AAC.1